MIFEEFEGILFSISTPRNKDGFFYNRYKQSKDDPGILMIQAPTWEVNPQVPLAFLEKAYNRNPNDFRSELGAEFVLLQEQ